MPSCDYPSAVIGVIAAEHEVSVQYDIGDGQREPERMCPADFWCTGDPCTYSITDRPSVATLYATVDGVGLEPYEVKLPRPTCTEDITYLVLDATKTPVEWVSKKVKSCD